MSVSGKYTHDALVLLAVKWLKLPNSRGGPGCQVSFSESRNGVCAGEVPDAIGFRAGVWDEGSVLVEVKVSRADFIADSKKPHRIDPAKGVGQYRYFLAPEGLIKEEELPPGWGLVEATPRGRLKVVCGHVKDANKRFSDGFVDVWRFCERNRDYEISLLVRMTYRVGDLDALNRQFKEAHRAQAEQLQEINRLRREVHAQKLDLFRLRRLLRVNGIDVEQDFPGAAAMPRKKADL